MQIAIELPNDFVALQSKSEIQREICTAYALWLYQQERLTLMKAAELTGFDLYDFMLLCKTHRIPVIDMSSEELLDELDRLNTL